MIWVLYFRETSGAEILDSLGKEGTVTVDGAIFPHVF